ncbi:ankyrin repeat domain-containing protein 49-like [Bolinopsis microptera]|uniref:ankyrin repeat domain-containing protein 49-like n=1 Tax=Bolinopsis microptera TaxID=2820187 RepID=UPI003078C4F3
MNSEMSSIDALVEHCQSAVECEDIPTDLQFSSHVTGDEPQEESAMDDDCWKSQAVVDRDMLSEVPERVNWIHFVDGTPYGERLLKAAEQGCTALVEEILSGEPDVINYKDTDGYTPLHRACYQGWEDIVEILLLNGADRDSRTDDGWTPLHSAARWNKVLCAKLLIAAGCDVNAMSNGQQTPLHIACSSQACASVIHLLLWHCDTDVSLLNNSGETAEKVAFSSSLLGPLFELRHRFVDIDPMKDREILL